MFNLLGIGERAGSGLENIQIAWKEQEWLAPDLEEEYNPDRIVLTLRTISMLPENSIVLIKSALKNKYKELCRTELEIKKHRSVDLFNMLLLKNKIKRTGNDNKVKYVLVEGNTQRL